MASCATTPYSLFVQEQHALSLDQRRQPLRKLRQQPGKCHFELNVIFCNINRARYELSESADTKLQSVAGPALLLDRKHMTETCARVA